MTLLLKPPDADNTSGHLPLYKVYVYFHVFVLPTKCIQWNIRNDGNSLNIGILMTSMLKIHFSILLGSFKKPNAF